MPELITREDLVKELDGHLRTDEDDKRLAWVASIFLGDTFRVVGDGVFERRRFSDKQGGENKCVGISQMRT